MRKPDDIAKDIVGGCCCDEAYKGRGLAQPDCAWCDHGDEVTQICAALRDARAALREIASRACERDEETGRVCYEITGQKQHWCCSCIAYKALEGGTR